MSVDLGFVEKCEPWLLESRFFPSKVGGKPAWLDLENIPGAKDVECEYCKEPCVFLCQIYAPYEENNDAFHRTIFVFICKREECSKLNETGNLKVFRSQLPKVNRFFPSEPPIEQRDWRTDINVDQWAKTCYVCGISAPNHCSKCKKTNYCCRAHQVYDWKHGHKEICGSNREATKTNAFLLPEYEIVIEKEDANGESNINDSSKEEEEIKKYEAMIDKGEAGILQSEDVENTLLNLTDQQEDETFSQFRLIVDAYPDQILRYDRGGSVLYISSENQVSEIPICSECNGERQFEFQIMPQLLNFLNFEVALKCIDWGILAVFTCKRSCASKNGFSAEFIWKQDIVEAISLQ